jgi:hypothetical protein
MSQIARTRIRRYRPHGSALWVMCLRQPEEFDRADVIMRRIGRTLANISTPIAGFAIVVWDVSDSSACDWDIWERRIPNVLVADFVGERVRLEITQDRTIKRMEDDGLI